MVERSVVTSYNILEEQTTLKERKNNHNSEKNNNIKTTQQGTSKYNTKQANDKQDKRDHIKRHKTLC